MHVSYLLLVHTELLIPEQMKDDLDNHVKHADFSKHSLSPHDDAWRSCRRPTLHLELRLDILDLRRLTCIECVALRRRLTLHPSVECSDVLLCSSDDGSLNLLFRDVDSELNDWIEETVDRV